MSESGNSMVEFTQKVSSFDQMVRQYYIQSGLEFWTDKQDYNGFRIVLAGQYSAGKSSILKMLTGLDDIAIGAGITTQENHVYHWQDQIIVDTPGIHTALHPEHDEIAYNAILTANLIIYVTTNELFDDQNAQQFKELAVDKDRAGEMILVVNKMMRTAMGNTPEQQAIIREALIPVLNGYDPSQLHLCFIDAKSYLDSFKLQSEDPELAQIRMAQSGRDGFIQTLQRVIKKLQVTAPLTQNLNLLLEILNCTIDQLENTYTKPIEDNLSQKKHVFINTKLRLQTDLGHVIDKAVSDIKEIGYQSVDLITETCDQDKVERELGKKETRINQIMEQGLNQLQQIIENQFFELDANLKRIKTPEINDLRVNINGRIPKKTKWVSNLSSSVNSIQKVAKPLLDKITVSNASRLKDFTNTNLREWLGTVAHKFNIKLAPWSGDKIAQTISSGAEMVSKTLGIVAAGIAFVSEIKSKHDEAAIRQAVKENRRIIHDQFNDKSDEFEAACKAIVDQCNRALDDEIGGIDDRFGEIKADNERRNQMIAQLKAYKSECFSLLHEIHMYGNSIL